MKLLVSGSTQSVARFMEVRPDRIGILMTPADRHREWWPESATWACDNECFSGLDAPAYLRMLAKISEFKSRPQWVACPDVVGDAGSTWSNWFKWRPVLDALHLPAALVLQDGLEKFKWRSALPSEWARIDAVFVGGSTEWKLSEHASRLTMEAHERGKLCHWGRVNSKRRLRFLVHEMLAGRCWVDTVDGSGWSKFAEVRIPKFLRWVDAAFRHNQPTMF